MAVELVTPPATEPVTLDEAKIHCRVDGIAEDSFIEGLITAAREFCERRQRRAYITQTLEYSRDTWPAERRIELPYPKLQSVESVAYTDKDGVTHTFDASNYVVDNRSLFGAVVLKASASWPSATLTEANGVVVRYVAGYGTAASVPKRVKQAILLLVGHWYENREAVLTGTISKAIEFTLNALLAIDTVPRR